jgi:hypothetical protein
VTSTTMVNSGDPLERWCEDLVIAEMARLARRVPALGTEHLGQVETALGQIIDRLVLRQARMLGDDQLAALFDLRGAR